MLRSAVLASLALAPPLSAQQLWTVDDDGPADFASLQAAADFAADGDTLLVRDGTYGALLLDQKGLTVQGEENALVVIDSPVIPIRIKNLGASQEVLVRGFELRPDGSTNGLIFESIKLMNCAGPVLVEDCHIVGPNGEAVVIINCTSVTFVECTLVAAQNKALVAGIFYFGMVLFPGVDAKKSSLFFYDCTIRGGDGLPLMEFISETVMATAGNPAVVLQNSTLLASGCTLTGGQGGNGDSSWPWQGFPAPGGPGLMLWASEAQLIDCLLVGGAGGVTPGTTTVANDGPPSSADSSSLLTRLPGNARSFRPASPVTELSPIALHFEGDPGDVVLVHVALGIAPGFLVEPVGVALHLTWPYTVFSFGTLPASGVLDLSLPTPALPALPGYEHILFTSQALFIGADGFFDGGPRTVLITAQGL